MNNNLSLKDFLKKYTAISYEFIDEYYKFYEMCENNYYGIKLDDVLDYLNIKIDFFNHNNNKIIIIHLTVLNHVQTN